MNEVALFCSSKATGRPQALSRRNTLQVVAVASRPLSGMTSCLAPSPAVMSSFATTETRSEPLMRNIFLVFPSVTSAPSERAFECPAVGASTRSSSVRKRNAENNRSGPSASRAARGLFNTESGRVPVPIGGRSLSAGMTGWLQVVRLREGCCIRAAGLVLIMFHHFMKPCAIVPGERAPGRRLGLFPQSEGAKRRQALVRNAAPGGRLTAKPVPSAEGNSRSMTRTGTPFGASPRRFSLVLGTAFWKRTGAPITERP